MEKSSEVSDQRSGGGGTVEGVSCPARSGVKVLGTVSMVCRLELKMGWIQRVEHVQTGNTNKIPVMGPEFRGAIFKGNQSNL